MENYIQQITNLRQQKDQDVASNSLHWINLVGLFPLKDGENTFGSDENNDIILPQFPNPLCGSFIVQDSEVTLQPKAEIKIDFRGNPLKTDASDEADLINIASLAMKIIIRGGRPMLRIWDREAEQKNHFTGFHYYPIKPEYKVTAKFVRYDSPKPIIITEVIGTQVEKFLLGEAQFTLNGHSCTLIAEKSGDNELLFNFTDLTNKETTYGGGRRFYLPIPAGEEIILDFNQTSNWPCAYTPFATCPIPPKENRLPIKIEAGELKYKE